MIELYIFVTLNCRIFYFILFYQNQIMLSQQDCREKG